MKRKNSMKFILKSVMIRAKLLTIGIVFAIAGAIVFALLPPLALEKIINDLTAGHTIGIQNALLYFALIAAAGLFDTAKEILITIFGQKITRELRHEMCGKLSRMPASYFTKNEPGVTASRFVNDVDTMESLFTSGIISMFVDACKVISIMFMIFVKSRGLGILMLFVTPMLFFLTRIIQRRMLKAQLANRAAVGKANNHVPETIRNIRMIHNFHKEKYMESKYDDYILKSYRAMEKSNFYDAIYSPIILVVSAVIVAVMMILSAMGGEMQSFFGMSVGTAVAVIAYVGKVFEPLESIGMEIQNIQSAVAGVHRINELLDEPERGEADRSIRCRQLLQSNMPCIELNNIRFGYNKNEPVLNGRSFTVKQGESVTLTGKTGAGKSTIFKLILGLYSPDSGSVRVFGAQACRIPDREKRTLFGYVEQTFRMVPGTVAEQITLFDSSISRKDAEKAAQIVGLHESIAKLESGYDTPCTESLFSQGEWQLLSIARAIAADPAILLLDEITANLDSGTEQMVISALKKASENRTVLSISHRLYEQTGGRQIKIEE